MKALLLLVDLQHDFLERSGLVPPAGSLIETAKKLLEDFRDASAPVVHLRTAVSREPDERLPHWKKEGLWVCDEGSPGAMPPAALKERDGESLVFKRGYGSEELATVISRHEPELVVVGGVMLHACVREAVLLLHGMGIRVLVAAEATGSDDLLQASAARRFLEQRGVEFASSEVLNERLCSRGEAEELADVATVVARVRSGGAAGRFSRGEGAARLLRLADELEREVDSLAEIMASDLGKPIAFARVEGLRSAAMLRAVCRRLSGDHYDSREGAAWVRRRPLGVVAVVTPWNNPLYLPLGKIAPALLCGDTVVWKPSPKAESLSRKLEDLMRRSGIPDTLVARIEGDGRTARALLRSGDIDGASVTGSMEAGFDAAEACLSRCLPLQAELGGNNAAVVWSDADLEMAAEKIVAGAFDQAGQRCTANRRVIVERRILEPFRDLLILETRKLAWGDPCDESTRIGPLVDERSRARVDGYVRRSVESGANEVRPLGDRPAGSIGGNFSWFPPTILTVERADAEIVQEETFGPVLVLQPADDWEDSIDKLNGVRQGLAASLFTRSPEWTERFLEQAEAGLLKINESTADADIDVPFGGWKSSGMGPPEHGASDLEFYTRSQSVYGYPEVSKSPKERGDGT